MDKLDIWHICNAWQSNGSEQTAVKPRLNSSGSNPATWKKGNWDLPLAWLLDSVSTTTLMLPSRGDGKERAPQSDCELLQLLSLSRSLIAIFSNSGLLHKPLYHTILHYPKVQNADSHHFIWFVVYHVIYQSHCTSCLLALSRSPLLLLWKRRRILRRPTVIRKAVQRTRNEVYITMCTYCVTTDRFKSPETSWLWQTSRSRLKTSWSHIPAWIFDGWTCPIDRLPVWPVRC